MLLEVMCSHRLPRFASRRPVLPFFERATRQICDHDMGNVQTISVNLKHRWNCPSCAVQAYYDSKSLVGCSSKVRDECLFFSFSQEEEAAKREKFEKELKALDGFAAAAASTGEACGWLCGEAGEGRMTLADVAYFPFLERIDATLEKFKVICLLNHDPPLPRQSGNSGTDNGPFD